MTYIYSVSISDLDNMEDRKIYCRQSACTMISSYAEPNETYTLSTREEIVNGTYRFVIEIEKVDQ